MALRELMEAPLVLLKAQYVSINNAIVCSYGSHIQEHKKIESVDHAVTLLVKPF